MSWRIGISSGACTDRPILEMLPAIVRSGARGIEVGTPPRHFDPWQPAQVDAVASALRTVGLEPVSIHAPFGGVLDLADPNPHHRHAAIGAVLTAASALKAIGGRLVVVHPSDITRRSSDVDARLAASAESLAILAASCRQEDMTLVLESPLPHLIGGQPEEFRWLVARLDESVRVCLDTGHAALGRHWRALLDAAGGRLLHVHANDNHGQGDDHLPPGDGTIDWSAVVSSLDACGFDGWIMLELHCPDDDPAAFFRRAFDRASDLLSVRA